jgi:two-component system, cell cycle response regulator DivK
MSKRILVVEDQEDDLQILRDLLTRAGFEIIEAKDGEEGVRAAVAERPDLILMDIQLPILDGYEARLPSWLRDLRNRADVPAD